MKFYKNVALVATICFLALAGSSCRKKENRSGDTNQKQPDGKWVSSYRTQASLNAGAYLSVFSYNAISLVSRQVIFVAANYPDPNSDLGRALVVRTTDGGASWKELSITGAGDQPGALNGIQFLNPTTGWVVGSDDKGGGVLFHTTDGGETWSSQKLPVKGVPTSIHFVDSEKGWIVGSNPAPGGDEYSQGGPSDILATTDGGKTWTQAYHLPASMNDITFVDSQNAWTAGVPASIYHTSDGGRTWSSEITGLETQEGVTQLKGAKQKPFNITSISFGDAVHGWAVAQSSDADRSVVIGTSDGGRTWNPVWIAQGQKLRSVHFVNASQGWVATEDGDYIYRTDDGGRRWNVEKVEIEQKEPVYRMAGSDPANLWAVGGGAIFRRVPQ
ncbi:MAG: WD40/YVTN/BNR-like repeat-containing protein [Blastocatellia bacterium]